MAVNSSSVPGGVSGAGSSSGGAGVAGGGRVTLRVIRQWVAAGRKFPMLTCYDATTARWLWQGGVRVLLVGDSAGAVILGHDSTLAADMPFMLAITAAVRRGAPQAFVMADMPFGSYQCGDDRALENAVAFLKQGQADAVKLEVDASFAPLVERMSRAGVPVVPHVGWRPQQARYAGVRTAVVAGRTRQQVEDLAEHAHRLEQAGAVMLLVEQCTAPTAARIVERVSIPVIGCGGGPACHGHVVVLQDLLGMTDVHPSFVKPVAQMGRDIARAAGQWAKLVESGEYLAQDHPYQMSGQ